MPKLGFLILAAVLSAPPLAACAQGMDAPSTDKSACAAVDTALPASLAAWTAKGELASAAAAADLPRAALAPGQAVKLALHPTAEVAYVTQPEKPGGSVSKGGMAQVEIKEAGTYRIALGAGAWLDVLKDGHPVTSVAHAPGVPCSTIRKMVDFPLEPGAYIIQVSANADPVLAILVARQP